MKIKLKKIMKFQSKKRLSEWQVWSSLTERTIIEVYWLMVLVSYENGERTERTLGENQSNQSFLP